MTSATVALVTGGTSGLGLAVAARLLRDGVTPVILGRSEERGRHALKTLGGPALFVRGDAVGEQDVARALDVATERGHLRAVVNCAGAPHAAKVVGRAGPHSLRDFTDVVTANLVSAFNVVRLAAERMMANPPLEQERGVIVNTASLAAFDGQIGQAAYAASKGGMVSMTLPLARELAASLIRVVTVAPGFFETPAVAAVPEEARRELDRDLLHPRRWGDPAEFADLVAHIIGNPMINGETIRIDGAVRMSPGRRPRSS
ncbi:SDR family NAD(P)-dependent oxidoreductase [Streptomyces sp. VRA16 Mangrove soil]|uniref:SDR family NAD(P)-dependent oxidoreductase n=1 Tax=Streptomyces sp. VRA16 Mangrove soil TaxID=2817434 RepID=UPI001A9D9B35|nr:SDR family NAD(P)-dependent oxidoreductase [Streptomyces sp. VRA16 Mangrove soil]MBO1334075.1 SDR family NAD(P)-dependent oxidoreductase [Streptomyces sp. VRA16 Mangrove soil]